MSRVGAGRHFRVRGPKVKICGVADHQSLREITQLGVDAVGFVFYDASPRAVVGAQVKSWLEDMPPFVQTVGVFVDEKPAQVKKIFDLCGLSYVQLHGQESPEYCAELPKGGVIKAFRVKNGFHPGMIKPYIAHISAVLLDSASSGESFDWSVARQVREAYPETPLILAGGIAADNVDEAVRQVRPYAIDVSSSVESSPGVKDPVKVQDLLRRLVVESTAGQGRPSAERTMDGLSGRSAAVH